MTDKERLEEIRKLLDLIDSDVNLLFIANKKREVIKIFEKQAERVQDLESENRALKAVARSNKNIGEQYLEQNKRYQDLLKEIIGFMETDAEIYLTDKARLNGIHDALVEFYKEETE